MVLGLRTMCLRIPVTTNSYTSGDWTLNWRLLNHEFNHLTWNCGWFLYAHASLPPLMKSNNVALSLSTCPCYKPKLYSSAHAPQSPTLEILHIELGERGERGERGPKLTPMRQYVSAQELQWLGYSFGYLDWVIKKQIVKEKSSKVLSITIRIFLHLKGYGFWING